MSDERSDAMPDEFDRMLGVLENVGHTAKTTIPVIPKLGVGGTRTFIVRTIRHEGEDHLFIEMIGRDRSIREYFPPAITAAITRQRDSLTSRSRRAGARQAALTRKALGIEPAFLKGRKKKGGR